MHKSQEFEANIILSVIDTENDLVQEQIRNDRHLQQLANQACLSSEDISATAQSMLAKRMEEKYEHRCMRIQAVFNTIRQELMQIATE